MARLLLAQVSRLDLQKAQARSFGHAKRRARITAALEENRPPPAVKRPIGLNNRMKPCGRTGGEGGKPEGEGGGSNDGVGDAKLVNMSDVSPAATGKAEAAQLELGHTKGPLVGGERFKTRQEKILSPSASSCLAPTSANACRLCRRVVLGHPLDTISTRCGGFLGVRNHQGGQRLVSAPGAAEATRTAGMRALRMASVADERYVVKHASFEVASNGGGSAGVRRGNQSGGIGAAAVSQVSVRNSDQA